MKGQQGFLQLFVNPLPQTKDSVYLIGLKIIYFFGSSFGASLSLGLPASFLTMT